MNPDSATLVSSVILQGLKEAAAEIGVSVEPLLRRFDIDPGLLKTFEGYMPAIPFIEFLESAAEEFDCPHFGLLVASHRPSLAYGVLAQLIKASPDVGTALEHAHRRLLVFTQTSLWNIEVEADTAALVRANRNPIERSMVQTQSLAIGSYFKLLKALLGPNWHPLSVSFTYPSPVSERFHKHLFQAPVYFGQEYTGISFRASDLQVPIATADPDLLAIIEQHIDTLANAVDDDMGSRVKLLIRQHLDTGTCTIDVIAGKLGIHRKALQRLLSAQNTTFKEELSETRMQLAEFYLLHSQIELLDLSHILGYSGPSALSRGFKKQHGVSPQQWRQANRKHGSQLS